MVNIKQLKCPACGSTEIEQQSKKLVKCSHCGSSLIVNGSLLTSVSENSIKTSERSKSTLYLVIPLMVFFGLIVLFINYHNNDDIKPIVDEILVKKEPLTKVDPIKVEERKKINEASFTPKIEIISKTQGETVIGGLFWIVKVKNISTQAVSRTRVVVSIFNDKNSRLKEQSGWSIKEALQPNETSVVLVLIPKPPPEMDRFEISASASKMSFMVKNQVDMEVIDFVVNQNNNRFEIVGDVKNPNNFKVNYTKVIAEALDENNKPVGLAHQFSTKKALIDGESSGFKISSTTFISGQPASWRLWAIARKE